MTTEYISTETGCQYLRKYKIEDGTSFLYDEGFNDGIETAISCIGNEVPAADVRPVVRGEWLSYPVLDDMCYQHYSCSVCKRVEAIPHGYDVKKELPFCHCGADMREVKADG